MRLSLREHLAPDVEGVGGQTQTKVRDVGFVVVGDQILRLGGAAEKYGQEIL